MSDWYKPEATIPSSQPPFGAPPPPGPPGGSQPPPPPGRPRRITRWWPAVVGGLWAIAALCVLVAVIVTRSGDDEPVSALPTPDTVRLEPVTYRNPAPFTPSVVTADVGGLAGRVAGSTSAELPVPTGAVTGDAAHLYASTSTEPVCDKAALAQRLQRNAKMARVWAKASGVEPAGIDGLLTSLTPVVLRADTAVTNHIYSDGGATAYPSVLEAGTPVMVDPTGLPRVQCSCGNPLLAPAAERPTRTEGKRWKSFDSARVVSVAPAAAPLPAINTVDLDTSKPVTTGTGSNTVLDGTLIAAKSGLHVATPDGQRVTLLEQPVEKVFDDGNGGLIYTLTGADPGGYPGSDALATIWHLPAGAAEAQPLVAPAQPGGWNELLAVGRLADRTYVVFGRLHEEKPFEEAPTDTAVGDIVAMDVESRSESMIEEGAYYWEGGPVSVSFGGDRLANVGISEIYGSWATFGPGLAPVANQCRTEDMLDVAVPAGTLPCPAPGVLDDSGNLLGINDPLDDAGPPTVVWTDPTTGEKGQGTALQATPTLDSFTRPEQVRSGRLVTTTNGSGRFVWALYDLSNGAPITLPVDGLEVTQVWMLTAPIVRPTAAAPAPRAESPAYRAPTVDELKAGFPSAVCDVEAGLIPIGPEGHGSSGADTDAPDFVEISFADQVAQVDVDGDGVEETVVSAVCSWGGTSFTTPLAALRVGPTGIEVVGELYKEFGRGARAIGSVVASEGGVKVSGDSWADGDALCCPSQTFTARLKFVDGRWRES